MWILSYFAYYAYHWQIILHIILHIQLHIMHIVHSAYCVHIYLHIACVRPWLCPRAIHIMRIFWHIMHIILHIYWHILPIGSMIYCAYSVYLLTYCFNIFHIMHIMHIIFILVIFYIAYFVYITHFSVFGCLFPTARNMDDVLPPNSKSRIGAQLEPAVGHRSMR